MSTGRADPRTLDLLDLGQRAEEEEKVWKQAERKEVEK